LIHNDNKVKQKLTI